jgi:hypothetical protein
MRRDIEREPSDHDQERESSNSLNSDASSAVTQKIAAYIRDRSFSGSLSASWDEAGDLADGMLSGSMQFRAKRMGNSTFFDLFRRGYPPLLK